MDEVTKGRLEVLLKHWIEHNREHGEEFREWAGTAGDIGEAVAREAILGAARQMDKANEFLLKAARSLEQ